MFRSAFLAAAFLAASSTAFADDALVAKGKALFAVCKACHSTGEGEPHRTGPNLFGVAGRGSAKAAGYNYSPAMRGANLTWDDATMDKWLTKPSALVPKTKMIYAGQPDPEKRKALIAYMKSLKK
jgi:cytochrome c